MAAITVTVPSGALACFSATAAALATGRPKFPLACLPLVFQVHPEAKLDYARYGNHRAIPVVVCDGPTAGGGSFSTADPVEPGVPLGPALGGTCGMFHGPPPLAIATATRNARAITANLPKLPSQS